MFAPLLKGSAWKSLVKRDNPELNSAALTRTISFEPDANHINAFKTVCKLKDSADSIPFLYPAVVLLYPNICLLASPEYPFPAVGSVHVYNTTTLLQPLSSKQKYNSVLAADKTVKHAKKGSEVEFVSSMSDTSGKIVWTNSTKFLVMHNQRKKSDSTAGVQSTPWPEPETATLKLLLEDTWVLGPNASREYAAVSKDYNPIHTSSIVAKLFGFPGIIMHGMYMITRAASECQQAMGDHISYPLEVSTKFQRPCVLPQKVLFQIFTINGSRKQLYFVVKGKNDKVLLDGYLTASA